MAGGWWLVKSGCAARHEVGSCLLLATSHQQPATHTPMAASVEELLQNNAARLWRAREQAAASATPAGLPTGYPELDC